MIGGTSSRQTGWRDDAYDEAIQKGKKQNMDSCEDDTTLKYSSTMRSRPTCDKHIVSCITSTCMIAMVLNFAAITLKAVTT
jgi:hypothetical protein